MRNKVKLGIEKYPSKRAYATGKLSKFLKERNLYDKFKNNCIILDAGKGHTYISTAFNWEETVEGSKFWNQICRDFAIYDHGET